MNGAPIIVTGASKGIGLAVTQGLLRQGVPVVATALEEDLLKELFATEEGAYPLAWDLSATETLDAYIDQIMERFGSVRGFVHCAGFNKVVPLYLNKLNDYESLWRLHALAPMRLITLLAKKGRAFPGASFGLVSSLSAHEGAAGNAAYAAAKGALEGFLMPAAAELLERQIRLNIVVPGMVQTDLSATFLRRLSEEKRADIECSYPMGFGQPEQVAEMILFLLSEKADWITGQKFFLDGGHMCRK